MTIEYSPLHRAGLGLAAVLGGLSVAVTASLAVLVATAPPEPTKPRLRVPETTPPRYAIPAGERPTNVSASPTK